MFTSLRTFKIVWEEGGRGRRSPCPEVVVGQWLEHSVVVLVGQGCQFGQGRRVSLGVLQH